MRTTTFGSHLWSRRSAILRTVPACVGLLVTGISHAQETNRAGRVAINDPYAITSLTLTGSAFAMPLVSMSQAMEELKQKIQLALATKDYQAALNYTAMGLRVSPSDTQLLEAKAAALVGLHQDSAAIEAMKEILTVLPDNMEAAGSLAELLLITNQIGQYRSFVAEHKIQIESALDGQLAKYFSVLEAYQMADEEKFREAVIKALTALPSSPSAQLRGWEFNELLYVLSKQPNSPKKAMLLTYVRVLSGDVKRDEALKTIKGL